MLHEKMWNVFKETGSVEAYLYCQEYKHLLKGNKDYKIVATEVDLLEEAKINSL